MKNTAIFSLSLILLVIMIFPKKTIMYKNGFKNGYASCELDQYENYYGNLNKINSHPFEQAEEFQSNVTIQK